LFIEASYQAQEQVNCAAAETTKDHGFVFGYKERNKGKVVEVPAQAGGAES
jgi:hypothetical protein